MSAESEMEVSGEVEAPPPRPPLNTEGLLECPVCLEFLGSQVYQCTDGHIICLSCYRQLQVPRRCHQCRTPFPLVYIRNRAVERIADRAVTLGLVDPPRAPEPPPPTATVRNQYRVDDARPPKLPKHGVTCDGSNCILAGKGAIEGVRYRCAECRSYDLCDACAKDGLHSHHLLIRIARPEQDRKVELAIGRWHAAKGMIPASQDETRPRRFLPPRRATATATGPATAVADTALLNALGVRTARVERPLFENRPLGTTLFGTPNPPLNTTVAAATALNNVTNVTPQITVAQVTEVNDQPPRTVAATAFTVATATLDNVRPLGFTQGQTTTTTNGSAFASVTTIYGGTSQASAFSYGNRVGQDQFHGSGTSGGLPPYNSGQTSSTTLPTTSSGVTVAAGNSSGLSALTSFASFIERFRDLRAVAGAQNPDLATASRPVNEVSVMMATVEEEEEESIDETEEGEREVGELIGGGSDAEEGYATGDEDADSVVSFGSDFPDLSGDEFELDDVELDDVELDEVEGDEVDGDEVEGDEVGGDEVGGDEFDGDEVEGDEVGGDEVDGDEGEGDEFGGDEVDGDADAASNEENRIDA